jgi:glycosyltransferase involved in cell wall biosynthesis
MRIAFVVDKCAPEFVGGYETRTLALAQELAAHHEVRIYTSGSGSSRLSDSLTVVGISGSAYRGTETGKRSLLHGAAFAISLMRCPFVDWTPDVCIVESIPYVHLFAVRRWARRLPTRFVLDFHEAWSSSGYLRTKQLSLTAVVVRTAIPIALQFADLCLAVSSATEQSLSQEFGVDGKLIALIPNGTDVPEPGEHRFDSPSSAGTLERQNDFVTIGRLVQPKRQGDLIEALAILKSRDGWRGRAVVIGEGPERTRLEHLVRRRGLTGHVALMGLADSASKLRALRDSRIFVLTSEREGFSIATLEAMAEGLPVIAARPKSDDVFGVMDLVTEGVNGYYYPCGDAVALANLLRVALGSPEHCIDLGNRGRQRSASFRWSRIADELESHLRTLTAS